MAKVLLIDVDSTIPNIALMKISAWHRAQGDQVSWNEPNPDIIYASIIFTENRYKLYFLKQNYPNAEIHIGGSGYSFEELPEEIDIMMPDYSIYKEKRTSYGFSTRGCIRNCKYCIVRKKEGKMRKYMRIKDFHNPEHKKVVLLDNNILALKEWFKENMEYIKEHNLVVDFNQGLDIRLIDQEIIDILKEINFQELRFAWDTMKVSDIVKRKLDFILENFPDFDVKHNISFYILVEFDTNIIDDLERVHYLRDRNIPCYIMPYQKIYPEQPDPIRQKHTKSLERYCNKRDEYFRYSNYFEYLKGENYSFSYYLKIQNEYNKQVGKQNGKV